MIQNPIFKLQKNSFEWNENSKLKVLRTAGDSGNQRSSKGEEAGNVPLKAELVFGDVVDEIDLVIERESTSQRRQHRLVHGLRRFLPEAPYEIGQCCHCSLSHHHLSGPLVSLPRKTRMAGFTVWLIPIWVGLESLPTPKSFLPNTRTNEPNQVRTVYFPRYLPRRPLFH